MAHSTIVHHVFTGCRSSSPKFDTPKKQERATNAIHASCLSLPQGWREHRPWGLSTSRDSNSAVALNVNPLKIGGLQWNINVFPIHLTLQQVWASLVKKIERKKPQNSVLNLYPGFMNVILGLQVDPAALANGLASAFVVLIMFTKEVKHQNKSIIMYPPGS